MATLKVEVELDGANKTVEVKTPPKKVCNITDFLPRSVIDLVKSAPNNDTIRNLLLAHLKVPVPREEDTFEKVKHWIEYNVEFNAPAVPKPKSMADIQREAEERETAQRNASTDVEVTAECREHGGCRFHQTVRGRGGVPVHRDELHSCACDADDAADFFDRVLHDIYDTGVRDYVSLEADGPEETTDHETDDDDGTTADITEAGKQALKNALRNIDREEFDRLFPNG